MAKSALQLDLSITYATARGGRPSAASFRQWVTAALQGRVRRAELALRLVDEEEGRELNRNYRQRDYATNVLSFPAELPPGLPASAMSMLGDIAICAPVVEREALEQGKPARAHFAHLTVHGVLHLLGFEHETAEQADAMEAIERQVLAGLGFDDPYAGERD